MRLIGTGASGIRLNTCLDTVAIILLMSYLV